VKILPWVVVGMIWAVIGRKRAPTACAEPVQEMSPAEIAAHQTLNNAPALSLTDCIHLEAIKTIIGTAQRYRIQNWYGRRIRTSSTVLLKNIEQRHNRHFGTDNLRTDTMTKQSGIAEE
jgi:hypothetical protein